MEYRIISADCHIRCENAGKLYGVLI